MRAERWVVSAARDLGLPTLQTGHGFKPYRNVADTHERSAWYRRHVPRERSAEENHPNGRGSATRRIPEGDADDDRSTFELTRAAPCNGMT
jgi:hypothetical protein